MEISTFRLSLLRATYLLIAVGLGVQIWPRILHPPMDLEHMRGVVRSLLGAVALLAVFGFRYPLKMLPLLLFEFVWKSIWVLAFGIPLWRAGGFVEGTRETWYDCLISLALFLLVIPWPYVFHSYVTQRGEPWRRRLPSPALE
jgi:hypothetical protein